VDPEATPNWVQMLETVMGLGDPSAIYLACLHAPPEEQCAQILEFMEGKGVPVHCVCFDPETDVTEQFYMDLCGEMGILAVDTSRRDMTKVDTMMQSVKTKKKALEKLLKQLEKMEDVRPKWEMTNEILDEQLAILDFVKNDLEVCEGALAGNDLQRDDEGNLILPPGTPVPEF